MQKKSGLSSVKGKLVISMLAITAIPLIITTLVFYFRTVSTLKSEAKITLNWSAWYIECEVNDIFARTEISLKTLAVSSDTIDFLKTGGGRRKSLSAISEENAASSENTGAAVEELSATVTTLADSAAQLKDISDQLTEEMKFFK